MITILAATRNRNKLREIRSLLHDLPLSVLSYDDIDMPVDEIAESGATFTENACIKALKSAQATHMYAVADDSGLCVDALDGAPGIYSARYAGSEKSDYKNCRKILSEMSSVPDKDRSARFVCAIAFSSPKRIIETVEGDCSGLITRAMKGENGFGYDPVFYYPPKQKTMAEMEPEEKNRLSHRYKALTALKKVIKEYLDTGRETT